MHGPGDRYLHGEERREDHFSLFAAFNSGKKILNRLFKQTYLKHAPEEDKTEFFRRVVIALLLIILALMPAMLPASEPDPDKKIPFDISQQRADRALIQFAERADVTFMFPFDEAQAKTANPLVGTYTLKEAISILLRGTGLQPEFGTDGGISIRSDAQLQSVGKTAEGDSTMTKNGKKGKHVRRLAAGVAALFAVTASAQSTATDEEYSSVMEEIIVTTQYREQMLRDVPVAVTYFSGEVIEALHIQEFSDLSLLTPGFVSVPNYSFMRFSSIRGIASTDFGFATDPSIAIFANGIYQGRAGTQVNSLYDIDRVEVIKGPQATLFGRSSIAGAISVIANAPTDELGGYLAGSLGSRERIHLTGVVNVPVSDTLAIRFAAHYENEDGYLKNLGGGPDVGATDIQAARMTAQYDPTSRFSATFRVGVEDRDESSNIYQRFDLPDFTVESTLVGDQNRSLFDIFDTSLDLNYVVNDTTSLKSITAFRSVQNEYAEDWDNEAEVVAGPYVQGHDSDVFQQELRLVYQNDYGLNIVVGASYFTEDWSSFVENTVDTTFAFFGTVDVSTLLPRDFSQAFNERGDFDGDFSGWSAYADISYDVTDKVTLTGGVRYNYDQKEYTATIPDPATLAVNANAPFPCACYIWGAYLGQPLTLEKDWDNVSFRAALNYDLSNDVVTYFAFNQGWKAGGIDSFTFDAPLDFPFFFGLDLAAAGGKLRAFAPESSDSYEVGLKGNLFERRLQLSLAAYHYVYKDLQKIIFKNGQTIVENVGKAKGYGFEGDVNFDVNDTLNLFANVAYNHTNVTEFDPDPTQVGLPLNRAPKWSFAGGGAVTLPAPFDLPGEVYFLAYATYQDSFRNNDQLVNNVDSYTLANMQLGYLSGKNRYSVNLFVDNVFDKAAYNTFLPASPFFFVEDSRSTLGIPRTIGIDFRVSF